MSTNSANRNVVMILAGAGMLCLCLCVLFVGGVFAFRKEVGQAVPALQPVLSANDQATATPQRVLSRTPAPTKTRLPTEPRLVEVTVVRLPTEPSAPTEPPAPTKPPRVEVTVPAASTAEGPTPTQRAASSLDPAIARSMDEIQQQVIEIRGLQPSGTFSRDVLTPAQLRENTILDFHKDNTPEDIRKDVIELSALGLLEPGFDLGTFYIDLLSEQVAGYYKNETKEMFVVGEQFGGMERLTYSHEYVHALQDQNFDIKNGLQYDTEPCKLDSERCAGVQALLEGDASLAQLDWFTKYATTQDFTDITEFYTNFTMPVYDSAPDFMKADFLFPYEAGQKFVEALYKQGGWEAVNAAYAGVPVSTEQIIHPERYPADKPVKVQLADFSAALGDGWQEITRNVMGEWYTYLILAKGLDSSYRLDDGTASAAAEGWGGDAYAVYYNDQSGESVLVVSYTWDALNEADEFASALIQYGRLRFGQPVSSEAGQTAWKYAGGYSIFRQTGQATQWVLAPSQTAAEAVWEAIGF